MPSDLQVELADLAPRPSRPLPMERVWARSLQLRRRRMLATGLAAMVAVVGAAGGIQVARDGGFNGDPAPVAPAQVATPRDENRRESLAQELRSEARVLRERLGALQQIRTELALQLQMAERANQLRDARQIRSRQTTLQAEVLVLSARLERLNRRLADLSGNGEGSRCRVAPRELPSGATPGDARSRPGSYGRVREWGNGRDRISLLPEIPRDFAFDLDEVPATQLVQVRGSRGAAIPIGDGATGQIVVTWRDDGCSFTLWVGPGLSLRDVREYARRF